ncbi:MAG: hypothetical protein Kow0056_07820 [Coriobacteriia bacterium]
MQRALHGGLALLLLLLALGGLAGCKGAQEDGAQAPPQEEVEGLEVGQTAPDFRLKNQDQATVALSDYRGTKNVILVFYPLAFTPV